MFYKIMVAILYKYNERRYIYDFHSIKVVTTFKFKYTVWEILQIHGYLYGKSKKYL